MPPPPQLSGRNRSPPVNRWGREIVKEQTVSSTFPIVYRFLSRGKCRSKCAVLLGGGRSRKRQEKKLTYPLFTAFLRGLTTFPMKRIAPLRVSRMKKMNGWSAVKTAGGSGRRAGVGGIRIVLAAAASVPSSLTSTYA